MAARANRKQQIEDLKAENARLTKELQAAPFPVTGEELVVDVPIAAAYRDDAAAAAIVRCQGNVRAALLFLGVAVEKMSNTQLQEIANATFCNDRVKAVLSAKLGSVEQIKDRIMQRMTDLALFGDADQATRASQFLANIFGWYAPKKLNVQTTGLTFHKLLTDPQSALQMMEGMREPGAPVATYSEANDFKLVGGKAIEIEHD